MRGARLAAAGKALCKERLQGALHALGPADLCAAGTELPPLRIVGYTPCCGEALLVVHLLTQYTMAVMQVFMWNGTAPMLPVSTRTCAFHIE